METTKRCNRNKYGKLILAKTEIEKIIKDMEDDLNLISPTLGETYYGDILKENLALQKIELGKCIKSINELSCFESSASMENELEIEWQDANAKQKHLPILSALFLIVGLIVISTQNFVLSFGTLCIIIGLVVRDSHLFLKNCDVNIEYTNKIVNIVADKLKKK